MTNSIKSVKILFLSKKILICKWWSQKLWKIKIYSPYFKLRTWPKIFRSVIQKRSAICMTMISKWENLWTSIEYLKAKGKTLISLKCTKMVLKIKMALRINTSLTATKRSLQLSNQMAKSILYGLYSMLVTICFSTHPKQQSSWAIMLRAAYSRQQEEWLGRWG